MYWFSGVVVVGGDSGGVGVNICRVFFAFRSFSEEL